jgi:hypothetical protein
MGGMIVILVWCSSVGTMFAPVTLDSILITIKCCRAFRVMRCRAIWSSLCSLCHHGIKTEGFP